jgi:hypothetical protein
MATHVFDLEWYPRDDGMHEYEVSWWAYKTDDRMDSRAVGETPIAALRLAVDTAMEHPANVPAPRALPNVQGDGSPDTNTQPAR